MILHLTQSVVEALKEPGEYRDDKVPGLFVRVSVNSKGKVHCVYKLNARIKGGKVITTTLGPHGRPGQAGVFTLESARTWAQEMIRKMRGGGDEKVPVNPASELKKQAAARKAEEEQLRLELEKKAYTLRMALEDYLSSKQASEGRTKGKVKGELAPRTAELYKQCFNSHLKDWLDQPLCAISKEMVSRRYQAICKPTVIGKIRKGGPAAAGNTFRALSVIFNHVIELKEGSVVSVNPVAVLKKQYKTIQERKNFINDFQMGEWWTAVSSFEDGYHADYFKLLLLTGLRKSELGSMKWEDVNFEERYWTVKNTKNGRDHSLPFSNHVEEILRRRYDVPGRGVYVFPGRSVEGCLKDVERVQKIIEEKSGIEFSPHDLRRTFLTTASRQVPAYMVKRFANHYDKNDITQSHYVKLAEVEMLREPIQAIEDFILQRAGVTKERSKSVQQKTG